MLCGVADLARVVQSCRLSTRERTPFDAPLGPGLWRDAAIKNGVHLGKCLFKRKLRFALGIASNDTALWPEDEDVAEFKSRSRIFLSFFQG